jgi:hypothetical protein
VLFGVVAITARRTRASVASFHLFALLLVAFSVYAYRDVLAAAYFHAGPSRSLEGALLWAKIG